LPKDSHNANISIVDDEAVRRGVAVLKDPVVKGNTLSYAVKARDWRNAGNGGKPALPRHLIRGRGAGASARWSVVR
jgi:hypothetical protein